MPAIKEAKVLYKNKLAGESWILGLEFGEELDFKTGQYLSLQVSDQGERRSYSIASRPNGRVLELMVDVAPMGLGSRYVLSLKEGDTIKALLPLGLFVVGDNDKDKLFIATGSGIAPFKAMIEEVLMSGFKGECKLIWGMRHEVDLFWTNEFDLLKNRYPNFSYQVVLSKGEEEWKGERGHVIDCLNKDQANYGNKEAYLCGNQGMIIETAAWLESKGMARGDIHFEKFY